MNNMLLPEDILREAVIRACERENTACGRLTAESEDPVFSDKFEKSIMKLNKTTKSGKKADIIEYPPIRVSKKSLRIKIALIAVIIMMFGSMTVMAVEPFREKVYQIIEKLFPNHTDISFDEVNETTQDNDTNSQIKSFNPADFPKKLKWVPEGFELYQEHVNKTTFKLFQFFDNSSSQQDFQQIEYQQVALENSGNWSLTSDGTPAKEIEVNGEKANLYTDEGGYHTIVMTKDGFAYIIGGNVEVDILIKCLELSFENE